MKRHLLLFGPAGMIGLILALNFQPQLLHAEERPRAATNQSRHTESRPQFDIEIINGQLQLASLKDRIDVNAKWGSATKGSVDATLRNIVEVLRDLHANANITMAPGVERISISDLKLRSTQLESELEALRVASGNRFIWALGGSASGGVPGPGFAGGGYGAAPVPTPAINPTTGLPEVLPISEFPLFVLTPNLQPSDATQVEVFNLTPYFQQQGEPDKKEIDENLKQIQEIILFTLDGMAVSEREGRPNFRFHPGANLLVVIGGPQSLEITRKVIGALQSQAGGDLAPLRAFGMPGGGVVGFRGGFFGSDAANPFGGGMSKNRRLILSKLESIHIESVQFDSFPLSEVVRILGEESKKRDPDKRGVNFLLQTSQPTGPSPVTGSPTAANPPMEATDLNTVAIRIPQPLNNVRMLDVLDAIVRTADHPIKYSITDYAVVFSLKELDDSAAMPPPSYGSPMGGTPPGGNTAGVPGIR